VSGYAQAPVRRKLSLGVDMLMPPKHAAVIIGFGRALMRAEKVADGPWGIAIEHIVAHCFGSVAEAMLNLTFGPQWVEHSGMHSDGDSFAPREKRHGCSRWPVLW